MARDPMQPSVYLVGAGPGNPGLLTLRAVEVLKLADVVLYDSIVPQRLLEFAPATATKVCVRDLQPRQQTLPKQIHTFILETVLAGKTVVHLKGGDPFIFGNCEEELRALRAAGISYEIVPGVTAGVAAGAFLEIPLTHRLQTGAVTFVAGHELPNKPGNPSDWKSLATLPTTLVIYMGVARLANTIAELIKHGMPPTTPATLVEKVSLGEQRSVFADLSELEETRRKAGMEFPGLLIVGNVVAERPKQSWFEARPLFGKRVLVTRPANQATDMVRKLEFLGAVVHRVSVIGIALPSDFTPVDAALQQFQSGVWDWLVFTSANGVHGLLNRLDAIGRDLRDLGGVSIAAIGPKTADVLRSYRLKADVIPEKSYSSEGLAEALAPLVSGKRVLLARANRGRDLLREELSKSAALVEQITVYDQIDQIDASDDFLDSLRRGEIRFVTLSSSNIARGVLGLFDETIRGRIARGEIQLVAISPETGNAVRALGYPVAAEAKVFTEDGLIEAVIQLAREDVTH